MRHLFSERRHRTPSSTDSAGSAGCAGPADVHPAESGWISLVGKGTGFHDCPLCRELASQGEATEGIETIVGVNPESLPELMRSGWLDDLIALVGPNATVQLMGRDLDSEPVEQISMAAFLARIGYE